MHRIKRNNRKKIGTAPGSLAYTGEKRDGIADVECISYNAEHIDIDTIKDILTWSETKERVHWIHITRAVDEHLVQHLGQRFGIHGLHLEDILHTVQFCRIYEEDNYVFSLLNRYEYEKDILKKEQISLIMTGNTVISMQESEDRSFLEPLRKRIMEGSGRIRRQGVCYLYYCLMDIVLDYYFPVLEDITQRLEESENAVLESPSTGTIRDIYRYRSDVLELRKDSRHVYEMMNRLDKEIRLSNGTDLSMYYHDLFEHAVMIRDSVDALRESITSLIELYMSNISNRMNEVMKTLTIISTIFIPLSFIVGLYGMNFRYMPELEFHWGYPAVLFILVIVVVVMLLFFKRKKWL